MKREKKLLRLKQLHQITKELILRIGVKATFHYKWQKEYEAFGGSFPEVIE